jgi:inorganic triphosphatase YgiF
MATSKALSQILEGLARLGDPGVSIGPAHDADLAGAPWTKPLASGDAVARQPKARRRRPAAVQKAPRENGQRGIPPDPPPERATRIRPANGASHPPVTDVELKLLVAPDELAALIESPPIVAHAQNKGTARVLKDTYYDTPAGALQRAGVTLRVRECRNRFVQTVKVAPAEPGIPLRRGEWKSPVASMAPDFQAVMPLMSMGLQDALAHDPLQPVFATELRRRLRTLRLPSGSVDVAFDTGVIKSGERTAAICEVELKRGEPAALYDLALMLSDHAAVRPALRSKAERGFELAFDAAPAVHGAARQLLASGEVSLDDAFAQLLRSTLHQLLLNQAAAENGRDPEGVHQLRIELRRLRCVLAMLRALAPSAMLDSLRADAKWLAAALSSARNWDVFLGETLTKVAHACSSVTGFDLVREIAEQWRQTGYVTARAALADRRAGRFELALGAWVEQRGWRCDVSGEHLTDLTSPATAFAVRALAKQHDRVLKRGRRFKRLPLEARHELRLAVKKLRYTVDFFLPLFGGNGVARRYARRLSRLQERLGRYNDAGTTHRLVAELRLDTLPPPAREAAGAVLGWQACRLAAAESEIRAAWRDFRDAPRPWGGRN